MTPRTRRALQVAPTVALVLGLGAVPASAHATCSDFDALAIEVHGHHVVRDYVMGAPLEWTPSGGVVGDAVRGRGAALPGGPGPAYHFAEGYAPGASFCNARSASPGWHVAP